LAIDINCRRDQFVVVMARAAFAGIHDRGTKVPKSGVSYDDRVVRGLRGFGAMPGKYHIARVTQGGGNL